MSPSSEELREKVYRLVSQQVAPIYAPMLSGGVDPSRPCNELGLDSIAVAQIVFALGEELEIDFSKIDLLRVPQVIAIGDIITVARFLLGQE